jgi:hypothetical protein
LHDAAFLVALLTAVLILILCGCTGVVQKNVEACAVAGELSNGADCAKTLTDDTREMTLDEFIEFLEPQNERGPAICLSSEDFASLKTTLEQACAKIKGCAKETELQMNEVQGRIERLQLTSRWKKRPKKQ